MSIYTGNKLDLYDIEARRKNNLFQKSPFMESNPLAAKFRKKNLHSGNETNNVKAASKNENLKIKFQP